MSMSKIALAIPLLSLGIACSTAGGQNSEHTGAMWTEQQHRDAATQAYMQGTGSGGSQSQDPAATPQGGATSDPSAVAVAGSSGASGSPGSSDSSGSSGSGSMGSSDSGSSGSGSSGSMGAGGSSETMGSSQNADQGSSAGSSDQEHGATAGAGNTGAHAGDQRVHGKITKISDDEISIAQKGAEAKTLKISPQTVVQMNGKDVKPSQLKKGQFVRASYENVSGDDVAVRIESGKMRHGQSGHMMKHHGTSGSSGGSSGASDSGASGGAGGSDTGSH